MESKFTTLGPPLLFNNSLQSGKLCPQCVEIFDGGSNEGNHHRQFDHINKSAKSGESFCLTSYYDTSAIIRNIPDRASPTRVLWKQELPHSASMLDSIFLRKLMTEYELAGDSQDRVDVIYEHIDQLPDAPLCSKECSATSTGHLGPLLQARKWLEDCTNGHKCESTRTSVPRRLLDLSDKKNIKVVTMEGYPPGAPYATLSYCWGPNPQFLRLTAENYNQLRGDIAISTLPQTSRDAILVTQTLGLSYLWIDSLCILQEGPGSEEDWLFHLHDMADVFSNCHVCISADNGTNPHKGLFSKRDHTLIQPLFFKATVVKVPDIEIYLTLNPKTQCSYAFADAPLWDRAWVAQERILAPRVLHFGRDQLYWECGSITLASEAFPSGMSTSEDFVRLPAFNIPDATIHMARFWYALTEHYAKLKLSHPEKDRLNGLAGIAKQVCRVLDDEYHAGTFTKHLPEQLMWSVITGSMPGRNNSRAPSWSWISINGGITWNMGVSTLGSKKNTLARLVHVQTWPRQENGNQWGGDQRGVISLVGPLLDISEIPFPHNSAKPLGTVAWDEDPMNDEVQNATLHGEPKALFVLGYPCPGNIIFFGLIIGRKVADEDYCRLGLFDLPLDVKSALATKINNENCRKMVRII